MLAHHQFSYHKQATSFKQHSAVGVTQHREPASRATMTSPGSDSMAEAVEKRPKDAERYATWIFVNKKNWSWRRLVVLCMSAKRRGGPPAGFVCTAGLRCDIPAAVALAYMLCPWGTRHGAAADAPVRKHTPYSLGIEISKCCAPMTLAKRVDTLQDFLRARFSCQKHSSHAVGRVFQPFFRSTVAWGLRYHH
jgi:hypothetical protein